MYGRVWEWKDTSVAWLGETEREEWYRQTAVAMGTQLLKAGRVSVEEKQCAAGAKGCHPEASLRTTQTAHGPGQLELLLTVWA